MKWNIYKNNLIDEAKKQDKDQDYINTLLKYSENLFRKNLPIITEPFHFSLLIGLDYNYLCKMAYAPQYFYRHFYIEKSNGRKRRIDEPLPDLKYVQRWILDEILTNVGVSPYAKAYVKGKSIKESARFHRAQDVLVTLDIKDFFPSILVSNVYLIFSKLGYRKDVASFLANLCCLKGKLPQGAPTSPCLSNIRMREVDDALRDFCNLERWRYTRYADDLCFSGASSCNVSKLIYFVRNILYKNEFMLNSKKTRIARKNTRQEVTGIVVNKHMQISKALRKEIRQRVYYIKKYGLDSHLDYIKETRKNYLLHMLGLASYGLYINPKDTELKEIVVFLKDLLKKQSAENTDQQ